MVNPTQIDSLFGELFGTQDVASQPIAAQPQVPVANVPVHPVVVVSEGSSDGSKRKHEEDSKVLRKRARERQRRADVGEKFRELVKVLSEAEAASGLTTVAKKGKDDDDGESRVVILERAIAFVRAVPDIAKRFTLKADERTVAGSLLGFTKSDKECQTDGVECLVVARTVLPASDVAQLTHQNVHHIANPSTDVALTVGGAHTIAFRRHQPLDDDDDDDHLQAAPLGAVGIHHQRRRRPPQEPLRPPPPRYGDDGKSYFALEA